MRAAVYQDRRKAWKWMLWSGSGGRRSVIAVSSQKYTRRESAVRGLKRLVDGLRGKGALEIDVVN